MNPPSLFESVRFGDKIGFVIGVSPQDSIYVVQLYRPGKQQTDVNLVPLLSLTNSTIEVSIVTPYWPVLVLSMSVWSTKALRYLPGAMDVYGIECDLNDNDYFPSELRKVRLDQANKAVMWDQLRLDAKPRTMALSIYLERLRFYDDLQSTLRSGKGVGATFRIVLENVGPDFISWFFRLIKEEAPVSSCQYDVVYTRSTNVHIESSEYIDRNVCNDKEMRLVTKSYKR